MEEKDCEQLQPGPNSIDRQVGAQIREHRENSGLTVQQCAAGLQVSVEHYQAYEAGTLRVSALSLFILSDLLGVPLSQFYVRVHQMIERPPTDRGN